METRQKSSEVLVERLLPTVNHSPEDRATAWGEWYSNVGAASVRAFVRVKNNSPVPDDDIVQEAMVTAYEQVEVGKYMPRAGIPFTAYVKGIARNKIREAQRHARRFIHLEDSPMVIPESKTPALETIIEHRERIIALSNGLSDLPPLRRQVLEGYLWGHSTEEIAQAVEISNEAVRQHKSRALRSLREMQPLYQD